MVTVKDLARESGVSVGCVSRVLNHHTNVSQETREKVLAAVEKLHYIPNESARYLKLQNTRTIVVIVKGIANTFFSPIIEILTEQLQDAGYKTSLVAANGVNDIVFLAQKLIFEKKPNGIIFLGGDFTNYAESLQQLTVPYVISAVGTADEKFQADKGSVIGGASYTSGYMVTRHLLDLGHRSIAVLQADPGSAMSRDRLAGYKAVLQEEGITYDPAMVYSAGDTEEGFSIEGGYHAMHKVLEEELRFTALVAFSDTLAFGAKRAILERGYQIPADVSLTGMDGTELARYASPSITTTENDPVAIANNTVQMLLELFEEDSKGRTLCIEPHLILGESTGQR